MTHNNEPTIIPPNEVGAYLRRGDWDTITVGTSPLAHICPLCGAMVPIGNAANGESRREAHARHHEWEATR